MGLIAILFYILTVAAQWVVFQKAGIAGWKSIIPIYNSYCLFKIAWEWMGIFSYDYSVSRCNS